MQTLWQDLRFGGRMLRNKPGFTIVAVLTLALGIGANSAIFSVVNAILLRPFSYKDAERLVLINHDYPKIQLKASVSAFGYKHYRDNAKSFEQVVAIGQTAFNLTGTGEPERLLGMNVSSNFFPALGASAAMGRVFAEGEDAQGKNRLAILSDAFWQRRFASDPQIIGKTIMLNGENHTIVGVMPASFQFGRELGFLTDVWAPIAFTDQQLSSNSLTNEFLVVLAKLRAGVTIEQAQAEMDSIATDLRGKYMQGLDRSGWGLTLQSFREFIVGDIRLALWVLLAAVGFVLLIACANVANLLLVRAAGRQKEIAIRAALGASRWRVIRQMLTESLLLSLTGGLLGLLLGWWGVSLLLSLNKDRIPRANELTLDWRVLGFTLGVAMLTGIIFGLIPAFQASRTDLHETLKEGGRSGASSMRGSLRGALVVIEVALSLVLLIGAGLLIRSFLKVQQVNPGFNPNKVLTMRMSLPVSKYREPPQRAEFYKQLIEQVAVLPGVQSAGAVSVLPMGGTNSSGSFQIEGRTVQPGELSPHGDRWAATPDYFRTMQLPLIRGRFFEARDSQDAPRGGGIYGNNARKNRPHREPGGKTNTVEGPRDNPRWREIVGIVGHAKHRGLDGESRVQYYIPHQQMQSSNMFLVVRTAGDPGGSANAVRGVIRNLDQDLPVFRVQVMEQYVADSMTQRRFAMTLLGIFAALALLLAAIGLYGVMAYSVAQRTHEIGIRLALGANRSDVVRLILKQGMLLALIGLGLGLIASFFLTKLMATLLFGVTARDLLIFIGVPLTLGSVSLAASWIPALRATKVDPLVALRYE